MISQFDFKNFDADETTRGMANVALGKILDRAPAGSSGVALLEKQDEGFRCSIDVYSQQGPFMASTVRATAGEAIRAIQSAGIKILKAAS